MKINKKSVLFIIILLPLFISYTEASGFLSGNVYSINKILKIIIFLCLLGKFLLSRKMVKNSYTIAVIFFFGWLFVSTAMEHGSFVKYFGFFSLWGTVFLLFEIYSAKYYEKIIDAMFWLYTLFFSINFVDMLTNLQRSLQDIGTYFVLGMDNTVPVVVLPGIVLALAVISKKEDRIRERIAVYNLVIGVLSVVFSFSTTGYIGLIVLFGLFFAHKKGKKIKDFRWLLWIYFIVCVLLIFGPARWLSEQLAAILFNKTGTYTSRFYLWDDAIQMIKDSWLFGYGIGESDNVILNTRLGLQYRHAHQQILQIGIYGGIIGIALFVNMIDKYYKVINRAVKNNLYDDYLAVVSIGIFAFLVMCLNEVYGQLSSLALLGFMGIYYVRSDYR